MRRRVFASTGGSALLSLGMAATGSRAFQVADAAAAVSYGHVDLDEVISREHGLNSKTADVSGTVGRAIADAPSGCYFKLTGVYHIRSTILIRRGNIVVDFPGRIIADDSFVGDFAVVVDVADYEPYFRAPVHIRAMNLDCRGVCRGVYARNIDHGVWSDLRIDRAYGYALLFDRVRESLISGLVITNGIARTDPNASAATDWGQSVNYAVGAIVRRIPSVWERARTYEIGSICSFHSKVYILGRSRKGGADVSPDTDLDWRPIPADYYRALKANSGSDPAVLNTNALVEAERIWQKIYIDEAALSVNDGVIDGADRSNQVTFVSPVIRDCGHICYVRFDSNKGPWPLTHINFLAGHVHNTFKEQDSRSNFKTASMQRMIEIGRCINVNMYAVNIRVTDSDFGICVLIGDQSSTKRAINVRFRDCVLSGKGENQAGFIVQGSTSGRRGNVVASCDYVFSGSSPIRLISKSEVPAGVFRGALSILEDSRRVGQGSTVYDGSANRRRSAPDDVENDEIRLGFSGGVATFELGARSGGRVVAGPDRRMSLFAEGGIHIAAEWDKSPFILGVYYFWVSSAGDLRVKRGRPKFDGDGLIVSFTS